MDPTDRRLLLLRRLAGVCAALVLAVTSLSAFMRLSHAGLGCTDWPQCYGQRLRQLQQGVPASADEQSATTVARVLHRVFATAALFLVVSMVLVCLGTRPVLRSEAAMALALLGLALFLAVLGRWSSGARVPAVALGNLLGGFAMLALSTRLAVAGVPVEALRLRVWVGAAMFLLLAQIALGGLVSASYAGLSCNAWSECLAAARDVDWDTLNPWREPRLNPLPPVNPDGALVHALHRGLGIVQVAVILPLAALALRRGRPGSAAALLILLLAQVAVGTLMSLDALHLQFALLHNVLAAALLATLVLLF
ncbi:MAG: COX15/CtaA family protein [Burkholderiaceae bacterium]